MAFASPQTIPSFTNPNRSHEDSLWGSSGVASRRGTSSSEAGGGIIKDVQDQVGSFLNGGREKRGLPMYKDKPYAYGASKRKGRSPRACQGIVGMLIACMLLGLYLLGVVKRRTADHAGSQWAWLTNSGRGAGHKIDWLERRENVVDAFKESWDAYVRHGWGECWR